MNKTIKALLTTSLSVCALLLIGCSSLSPAGMAIQKHDIEGLRKALDSGTPPDYIEEKGKYKGVSLLSWAIQQGYDDMAGLLLQRGASINNAAGSLFQTMKYMREDSALSFTKFMLAKGLDPSQRFADGYTPLLQSCRQPRVIELLLTKGARVEDRWVSSLKKYSHTPLGGCLIESAVANTEGRDQAIESSLILLRFGADPNSTEVENSVNMPLFYRAYELRNPRIIKAMLDSGVDMMARAEPSGETVLHRAAKLRDGHAARDLIAYAKISSRNKTNNSKEYNKPFISWLNQRFDDGESITRLSALSALAGAKIDTEIPAKYSLDTGRTALHIAARNGDINTIQILIEAGADPSLKDKAGYTAQNYLDQKIAADKASAIAAEEAYARRAEQAAEARQQSAENRQMLLAVGGAALIGKATSGNNFSDAQRSELAQAWTQDRVNAINGIQSNNFSKTADNVKGQLNIASMAAAAQAKSRDAPKAQDESQRTVAAPPQSTLTADSDALKAAGRIENETIYGDSLEEHQAKTWCQRKIPDFQKSMASGRNELISIGTCSCKPGGAAVALTKQFRCEFPVSYKVYESLSR